MGFANRRPILPAPTDSLLESAEETGLGTDVATDLSRMTDRTSQTIPADGRPITITTGQPRSAISKLVKSGNNSQTSLLIEYFEGGVGTDRRPSVRVKVTPSASKKSKIKTDGQVVITEGQSARRPSISHKVDLGSENTEHVIIEDSNISTLDSEVPFGRSRAPIEIEVARNQGSEISGSSASPEARFIVPESDISSMPADSMIGAVNSVPISQNVRSESISKDGIAEMETLKPPVIPIGRNASNERITQKVIEKLSNKPRLTTSHRRRVSDKTRSRSSASTELDRIHEPRHRTVKNIEDESITTATGSSLISGSALSAEPRSVDQRSTRSGTSNISINNPRLLQTVEDAIRRLILPELKELKKDHRSSYRTRYEQESLPSDMSGSSISREDSTRRRISGDKPRRRSGRASNVVPVDTTKRDRNVKEIEYDSPSEQSYHESESHDSVSIGDGGRIRRHRKSHKVRDAAAEALAGAALTTAALKRHESGSSVERVEEGPAGSKSLDSRTTSVTESERIFNKHDVPPMPMRSDIGSELTRSSLLSSNTTGTATPIQREVREVVRGSPRQLRSPDNRTPSRTPLDTTPVSIQRGLGTHHGNYSEQDLTIHREDEVYDRDDEPSNNYDSGYGSVGHSMLTDPERVKAYERNLHQQHPIRRGLSPIQSVASYTTTDPNRNSLIQPRSTESLGSPRKVPVLREEVSVESLSTAPSVDLAKSKRPHGISLENRSEIMEQHMGTPQDGSRNLDAEEFFDEQHSQNDQYRDSYANSGPRIPFQQMSNFTDDSVDVPYIDKVTAGQQVARGYGANPEYVHTPPGVESAVASLIEPSVMDLRDSQSSQRSYSISPVDREFESPLSQTHDVEYRKSGSPLKQQVSQHSTESLVQEQVINGRSDARSPAYSTERQRVNGRSPLRSPAYSEERQNLNSQSPLRSPAYSLERLKQHTPDVNRLAPGLTRHTPSTERYTPSMEQYSTGMVERHTPSIGRQTPSVGRHTPGAERFVPDVARSSEDVDLTHLSDREGLESPASEITTNPSVIQGPIGGIAHGSRDHWPYDPTPPRSKADIPLTGASREAETTGSNLVPEALSIHRDNRKDNVIANQNDITPPGVKDEGYETGANAASPALYNRQIDNQGARNINSDLQLDDVLENDDDPFTTNDRAQYISGFSQGLSPLYDNATGRGIDRIQSKDIVFLMDHLTVRDAQRNARDTEILVTLVRTAAEMRNSFEDMKKFIAEQDEIIMDTADKQHERTQKIIGGPRPQPGTVSRAARTSTSEASEVSAKRRSIFKRALKGLGSKNAQELQHIEDMLMQLLDDVEGLRAFHGLPPAADGPPQGVGFISNDRLRAPTDPGYEPEGHAGTSSPAARSGVFSNSSSRQNEHRGYSIKYGGGNRVSTVVEDDEEVDDYQQDSHHAHNQQDLQHTSHTIPSPDNASRHVRGVSEPLNTPPRLHDANYGAHSNENTPRMSNEATSSKKHRSFAASLMPKVMSRWSKTTASSGGDYNRNSTHIRQRPYSQISQSGSNVGEYDYDPQGDDRLRSNGSFQDEDYETQENRPPSPLIPSQVSDNPKYQAHRNSLNLQHPQPRQGPTGRFQTHLETEAQYYNNDMASPTSQTSSQWENQAALSGMPGSIPYAHGGHLSPISDGGYSETSAAMLDRDRPQDVRSNRSTSSLSRQGPPRPPKVLNDEPLVPQRPSKGVMSPSGNRQHTYVDDVAAARAGSPAYDKAPVSALRSSSGQTRKPSGPRPLSNTGQYGKGHKGDMNLVKKTRFRGSPNQIDSEEDVVY